VLKIHFEVAELTLITSYAMVEKTLWATIKESWCRQAKTSGSNPRREGRSLTEIGIFVSKTCAQQS